MRWGGGLVAEREERGARPESAGAVRKLRAAGSGSSGPPAVPLRRGCWAGRDAARAARGDPLRLTAASVSAIVPRPPAAVRVRCSTRFCVRRRGTGSDLTLPGRCSLLSQPLLRRLPGLPTLHVTRPAAGAASSTDFSQAPSLHKQNNVSYSIRQGSRGSRPAVSTLRSPHDRRTTAARRTTELPTAGAEHTSRAEDWALRPLTTCCPNDS